MIKLVSSDLNGTLVHQHTMSDMILKYVGREQFETAKVVFKRQTSGTATMEEAFSNAGPLTRGLTLRQAIDYTRDHMRYLNGFRQFVDGLEAREVPFVINSTGYSVTIYAIRQRFGESKIHGQIGNRLIFGLDADVSQTLREDELEKKVGEYFADPANTEFDQLKAVGIVELGIADEAAKAQLIKNYAARNFPGLDVRQIAHIGDTMGDSRGILDIAREGGVGVAFNYNPALENFLLGEVARNAPVGEIKFVDRKSAVSDLRRVDRVLF